MLAPRVLLTSYKYLNQCLPWKPAICFGNRWVFVKCRVFNKYRSYMSVLRSIFGSKSAKSKMIWKRFMSNRYLYSIFIFIIQFFIKCENIICHIKYHNLWGTAMWQISNRFLFTISIGLKIWNKISTVFRYTVPRIFIFLIELAKVLALLYEIFRIDRNDTEF